MTKENFYLSLYQAIMDKNITKALKLSKLCDEEEKNYPKEYPELNYNGIYKDEDPDDFLNSLFRTEEFIDFYGALSNALFNPLATEENITIREANKLELMKHPLVNFSINPAYGLSIIDALLSITYSTVISKQEFAHKLEELVGQSSVIDDILSVIAASTTIDSSRPFTIALVSEDMDKYDPTSTTAGYYSLVQNKLVVTNENSEINLDFLIHELAHKVMDLLFENSQDPYNSALKKDKYHTALKNTLLNIQEFIREVFDLDIVFDNQNDTWKMGKTLSTILYPQYLEGDEIQNFVMTFKKYNLNINDKFSWLEEYTPLKLALSYQKFELADSLVTAGATIKPTILHVAAMHDNSKIMNWFFENQQEIDINHKDFEGMTALDYASDLQIINTLISAGAIAYPPNYQPICRVPDSKFLDDEGDLTVIEEQLFALEKLLMFYNQDGTYNRSEEDAEFIVRLPQIIAAGLYKGKIIEVLEPSEVYWQEIISPSVQAYQEQHDVTEICLAPLDYVDFF
jgi:hypothetical protein